MGSGRQSDLGDQDDLRLLRERVAQLEQQNTQREASEERLQILFEQAPDAYYLSDLKGTFVDGNAAAERITGYKREELVHGSFLALKLLSARDVLRAASLLARNALGQSTGPDEFTLTRKDGTPVQVEIRTTPVRMGNRHLVLGIARDITERRKAEDALRESEGRYRGLVGNIPAIIFTIDLEGKLTFVNRRTKDLLGYESGEVINKSVLDFVPKEERQRVMESIQKGMAGEEIKHLQTLMITKSGEWLPFECSFTRVYKAGRVIGAQGTAVDITERKQAAAEIEALARFPAENPNPVLRVEERGAIIYANPAGESLLRCRVGDPLPPGWREGVVASLRDGTRTSLDVTWDGRVFSVLFVPIAGAGYANVYARDITERKQAEDTLRQSERSARQMAEVLQMVGRVSTAIIAGLDFGQLMQTIHEQCQLLFPIDTFYIVLYDAATESVSFPFMYEDGERRSLPSRCLRAEPGLLEHVIRSSQTVYLPDAAHSPIAMVRQPGIVSQSIVAVPMLLGDRVVGVLSMQTHLSNAYSQGQIQMFERLALQVVIAIQNSRLYDTVSRGLEATLAAVGRTAEMRDPYTAGHQRRVTDLSLAIARKLGYTDDSCRTLRIAGMLHDIGKLGVPAEILSKPTPLSKVELEIIRIHPQAAYDILTGVAFPGPVAEIVLQHHERLDGSGYPKQISGDDILPEARILAVADVVEAMGSHRPYRPALGMDAALNEIRAGRETRYDEQVVDACVALFESGEFSFQPASAG